MEKSLLIETILEIIKKNNILSGGNIINENTSLYDDCELDSVGVIDLVVCIEEKFNFEFNDTDLQLSNFATVSTIADLVNTKL